ncbi:MAG TPA: glycosyltransferase family 2 protein [Candidatus Methylacidiphilales bacterium]|nr:glycosyltransferase family 2 protein [Candidatus Methylacidiphilales bacterium]
MKSKLRYSVVIPYFNEGDNLPDLIAELDTVLSDMAEPAEVILVDDGSTDGYVPPSSTPRHPIRRLELDRNSGQSAAMFYGMQAARGDYVLLLDADMQNDPADLPKLLAKLRQDDLDFVTGIRTRRLDSWYRVASSKVANGVRSFLLRDKTSDTGCTLKVLKREVAQRMPAWNGMHRFMPALALSCGYKTGEVPVSHRPRHAGVSKVNTARRAIRATQDLMGMIWFTSRQIKGRLKPEVEAEIEKKEAVSTKSAADSLNVPRHVGDYADEGVAAGSSRAQNFNDTDSVNGHHS